MALDTQTLARARRAVQRAASTLLFEKNITMIDFGWRIRAGQLQTDELTVRVHVARKFSGDALGIALERGDTPEIPPTIGGFRVDIPEGHYTPHLWSWWNWRRPVVNPRSERADPLRGGISISDERHRSYGTLGGKVYDRATGQPMILSNWHVLAADWRARPGQRIYQPGRLDGGTADDTVAVLTRDAMDISLDAAVARLTGDRDLINDQVDLGPVTGVGLPELGMQVAKSGRRTGVTHGIVAGVEGTARIWYDNLYRIIRQVVTIEPRWSFAQVSDAGDSGSFWLDEADNRAIGLHFAGSNVPERALAINMQSVLTALDVTLSTERERPTTQAYQRRWTGASFDAAVHTNSGRRVRSTVEV